MKNLLTRLFIDPNEPRLRSGYRLLLQWALLEVLRTRGVSLMHSLTPTLFANDFVAGELATFVVITLSVFIARRVLDRRSFTSLGLKLDRRLVGDLLAGFLIAGVVVGLVFAVQNGLGWLIWKRPFWLPVKEHPWYQFRKLDVVFGGLGQWLLIYSMNSWQEEIYRRGYQLQNIAEGLNLVWGVIFSSLLFGFGHIGSPFFSWSAGLGLTLVGVWFALGYVRTRQLWLPMGLHLGWNFFEGPVFGFPVSGHDYFSLLEYRISAPVIITGGVYGPEAGLILIPAIAVGAVLVWYYTRRRNQEPDFPNNLST